MQAQLAQALSKILAAVNIQSPGSFWLGGQVITIDDSQRRGANAEAETEGAPLVRQLVARFYIVVTAGPLKKVCPMGRCARKPTTTSCSSYRLPIPAAIV